MPTAKIQHIDPDRQEDRQSGDYTQDTTEGKHPRGRVVRSGMSEESARCYDDEREHDCCDDLQFPSSSNGLDAHLLFVIGYSLFFTRF